MKNLIKFLLLIVMLNGGFITSCTPENINTNEEVSTEDTDPKKVCPPGQPDC